MISQAAPIFASARDHAISSIRSGVIRSTMRVESSLSIHWLSGQISAVRTINTGGVANISQFHSLCSSRWLAEDEAVHHEEEDARVAEEREEDEGEEEEAEEHDYSRSRIAPIQSSGTLIVPSVSVFFTLP